MGRRKPPPGSTPAAPNPHPRFVLTRFLPQISLRNLRKLDCYANRFPLRSKTLYMLSFALAAISVMKSRSTTCWIKSKVSMISRILTIFPSRSV